MRCSTAGSTTTVLVGSLARAVGEGVVVEVAMFGVDDVVAEAAATQPATNAIATTPRKRSSTIRPPQRTNVSTAS